MKYTDTRVKYDKANNTSDNSGDIKEQDMKICTTAVPMGDGFWLIKSDDKDRLMQRDIEAGKVNILFSEECHVAASAGVQSEIENAAMDVWMPVYVTHALKRYERIMWLTRPLLSFQEAKLIALALLNNHVDIDERKVGLKERLFITLSGCEAECPGLYKKCGVNQSALLARVESMTQIEIFSLVHSVEAFRCGDLSDISLETFFNITCSMEVNNDQESGGDKQEVNP